MSSHNNDLHPNSSPTHGAYLPPADQKTMLIRNVALFFFAASMMLYLAQLLLPSLIVRLAHDWRPMMLIAALFSIISLLFWYRGYIYQSGVVLLIGTIIATTSDTPELIATTSHGSGYILPILLGGLLLGRRVAWGLYLLSLGIIAVLVRFYGWDEDTINIIVINFLSTAIVTRVIYQADERERLLRERYLQQQELHDREQALRHAKEVTTILHSVRHDVKHPLATAEKLLGHANAHNIDEIAAAVRETIHRVLAILDSTFKDAEHPYRAAVEMIKLRPAITMIQARYRQFLTFEIDSSIDDGLAAPADLLLLERILDNVARNSARFATRIQLSWDGQSLQLRDDGPGFSEQALLALKHGQRVESDSGWGLGLVGITVTAKKHGIQILPFNHPAGGHQGRISAHGQAGAAGSAAQHGHVKIYHAPFRRPMPTTQIRC